jgi:hypothetical protein
MGIEGLAPALLSRMAEVAGQVSATPRGQREAVYRSAAEELGISMSTLKRHVAAFAGRQRCRRADAGQYRLTAQEAMLISTYLTETTRGTGKRLLSLEDAVSQLRANGLLQAARLDEGTGELVPLSLSAIGRALRGYQVHPDQLTAPAPVTRLRSKHPNHVWQLDPSLCVLYYLRPSAGASGLKVMPEAEFYKNKPANLARVEPDRVWRYVITDHTSGATYVEYRLGAESAVNLAETFIHAIQPREGLPFHGVPFILMMDPGSANISAVARNLFRSLRVELQINRPGNPRAKGQVERTNDLVERKFEAGLRFVPVADLAHLNRLAQQWAAWWNGTAEHTRHGMTRFEAWQHIRAEQLRLAPPVEVCKELARTAPESRVVSADLKVSFLGRQYHVDRVPGVLVGEKLEICRNPWREGGAQAVTLGANGRELFTLLDPVEGDDWGQDTRGAVIGEEYKSRVKTGAEYARESAERLAMGTDDLEEAEKLRKAKTLPFRGAVDPYKEAKEYQAPAWMPRRGTDHPIAAPVVVAAPLSLVSAAKRLRAAVEDGGGRWTPERYQWLAQRYPDGVPEEALEALAGELGQAHGKAELRIVR